jgi:transposase
MKLKFEIKFIISVPDIGKIGATTLIVEIDNNKNFPSGDKLAP